ncbi:hypothetical protein C8A01DRAFT_21496 [Parachaetomium inaequale]|uniref:Uncharacterized protein n=1 Tax=Parachaetomium inaequale TaxID=2588326 RepID=A0AAN6SL98_9PEZI|nr:hypothetical protein C8A01DRAFT_21496 [Parachaetomium inaequale]
MCRSVSVASSQTRTVISPEPDTRSRPSGEKATALTQLEWPLRTCCSAPVAVYQTRTVLSEDPDTTSRPSGEKATALTPTSSAKRESRFTPPGSKENTVEGRLEKASLMLRER